MQRVGSTRSRLNCPKRTLLPGGRVQALKEERRRLQTDVDRRRKAIQELYLDKVSGLIDTETFAQMNAAFLQQVQEAEARIAVLEADWASSRSGRAPAPLRWNG